MTARYFVVEEKNDEFILKNILPESLLHDTKIIVSSGYSAALSVIQSLFTLTPLPISFFFDSNTFSEEKIEEKKQFINSYLKKIFANEFFLFPMIPEMEALLFYKKDVLEKLVGQKIEDELWQRAKYQPKLVLKQLIASDKKHFLLEDSVINLSSDIADELRQNPLIQEIIGKHLIKFQDELKEEIAA